jgi:peptidoglycan hydrolase CwlO-like protein
MKKTMTWLAFGTAVLGMGISMPSCPGQQAMEQKIESLEKSNAELKAKLLNMDGNVKSALEKVTAADGQLNQLSQDAQAAKGRLDQLETAIKDLQSRASAPKGKPAGKKHSK